MFNDNASLYQHIAMLAAYGKSVAVVICNQRRDSQMLWTPTHIVGRCS